MSASSSNLSSTSASSSAQSSPSSSQSSIPKTKKAKIFFSSNGARAQRAAVLNATDYFNGDITQDDSFNFSEPTAPVSNQAHDSTPKARRAHQCHESGESNQMKTDIEYFIESLDKDKNRNDLRCLSLLGLAKKVMSIEYRMHLRAHDDMPRIVTKMTDAPDDPSLALSCATLMFIHNQDKMSSDIDPTALKLILDLINGGENVHSIENVEKKHKKVVLELCSQLKDNGIAKNINLDEITAARLATETLLGINSKRAGEWFKEEIRKLKGIDFIIDTIVHLTDDEDLEPTDEVLSTLSRCMHLLETITNQNIVNQEYIIRYNEGIFIDACLEFLLLFKREIMVVDDDLKLKALTTAAATMIRVLNNITSESEYSTIVCRRTELTDIMIYYVKDLQTFISQEYRSDMMVNSVSLLINMVEFSKSLRDYLINENRLHDLIDLFYERIRDAEHVEQQADFILDSQKRDKMTEAMQTSVLNQVMTKSEKNMEHTIIAACFAILFGCIIQDNPNHREQLISKLEKNSVSPLIDALQKLRDFAHLADIMNTTGHNRVKRILKVFTEKH